MSVRPLPWLAGAAAALAAVIVAELASAPAAPGPRTPPPRLAAAAAGPAVALDRSDDVAVVLARPLFARDRRPDPAQAAAATENQSLPHLTGILVVGGDRRAIFSGEGAAHSAVVREGDQVGAYRVTGITGNDVTLLGPDGSYAVRPRFSAASPAAASSTVAVPAFQLPQPPDAPRFVPPSQLGLADVRAGIAAGAQPAPAK